MWKRLRRRRTWRRIVYERLTEPLHLNLLSLPVALFGSYRSKIAFDLVVRQQHAYGLLRAADTARQLGIPGLTAVELGVAAGAGLLNIAAIARRVGSLTGIRFQVVGLDSGTGMPPPRDHRDHPELYQEGDYPMDREALLGALPPGVELLIGDLADTIPRLLGALHPGAPLGFVSIDLDYYWSTKGALGIFQAEPDHYLPATIVYLDDVTLETHNSWAGELLAIREFNAENEMRKIERPRFLRSERIFKHARWIDQIYLLHVFDHPARTVDPSRRRPLAHLDNPYL